MGKDPRKDGSMERVRNRMLAKNGRSPLYIWLQQNHDEFVDALRVVKRPDWSEIAAALADEGVLDGAGKPPTPTTVRQTWHKVKTDRSKPVADKKRAKPPSTAVRDGVVEIVPAPAAKPDPAPTQDDDDLDARLAKAAESMAFPWDPKPKPKKGKE